MEKNKVFVGGGSGFIGSRITRDLTNRGYDVTIISRNCNNNSKKKKPIERNNDCECVTWDHLRKTGFPPGLRAVVNVAGRNVLDPRNRWNESFKNEVYYSRICTARTVSDAISAMDPKNQPDSYVQITGVGYYGAENPAKEVDESSPSPNSDYFSRLTVDWENAAKLPDNSKTRLIRIRPGVVLGREGGMIRQLYWPFYFCLGGVSGSGQQHMPWIHVQDLSGLVIHSIENEKVEGVLNGVAPDIITNAEFTQTFAKSLGRFAVIPAPEFLWKFVFGEERSGLVLKGHKVIPKRTLESGFLFKFAKIGAACQEFSS